MNGMPRAGAESVANVVRRFVNTAGLDLRTFLREGDCCGCPRDRAFARWQRSVGWHFIWRCAPKTPLNSERRLLGGAAIVEVTDKATPIRACPAGSALPTRNIAKWAGRAKLPMTFEAAAKSLSAGQGALIARTLFGEVPGQDRWTVYVTDAALDHADIIMPRLHPSRLKDFTGLPIWAGNLQEGTRPPPSCSNSNRLTRSVPNRSRTSLSGAANPMIDHIGNAAPEHHCNYRACARPSRKKGCYCRRPAICANDRAGNVSSSSPSRIPRSSTAALGAQTSRSERSCPRRLMPLSCCRCLTAIEASSSKPEDRFIPGNDADADRQGAGDTLVRHFAAQLRNQSVCAKDVQFRHIVPRRAAVAGLLGVATGRYARARLDIAERLSRTALQRHPGQHVDTNWRTALRWTNWLSAARDDHNRERCLLVGLGGTPGMCASERCMRSAT
ncbi:hypothetical protein ACVIW0_001328 [Bradyrhizobium sp. USDA 4454]